ncbi:hypothetical protein COCNU_06G013350 [Cocos nucifera]|uniref:Uncharacterized protein n=1 Tax=Cocos nucifera TaxID=13894 RepID=A0A8K0IDE8_COCNU|nr:hypothetical protein COCNU_06G013350 [Cocos nucifera]
MPPCSTARSSACSPWGGAHGGNAVNDGHLDDILVLLAFTKKPRQALVVDDCRITANITIFAFKILLQERNLVTAITTILSVCK